MYNDIIELNIRTIENEAHKIMWRPITCDEEIKYLGACYDAIKYLKSVLKDREDLAKYHHEQEFKKHSD